MANKKRKLFPELERLNEQRQRQTATLAERQGAALGGDTRRQLKPLTRVKADKGAKSLSDLTVTFSASAQAARDALRQMSSGIMVAGFWSHGFPALGFRSTTIPALPFVDGIKLEALKDAMPYRVARRVPAPVVPDMVECITAWRAWDVVGEGARMRLQALGKEHIWKPRRAMEAECDKATAYEMMLGRRRVPAHDAPDWDCTCGVWSFKALDGLMSALERYSGVRVLGTVSLWGEVIETENGYRAQYAYPSELWLFDEMLEELGYIYDVPVRLVS